MNRFPLWKNLLIFCVIALGALYTLPNFFGQSPAVQISSLGTTPPVGPEVQNQVEQALKVAQLAETRASLDGVGLRVRFADTDTQLKARDIIDHVLNPEGQPQHYVVALNLVPNSPSWLSEIGALPMYLGLDLSGGVHFLLQVDQQAALTKRLEGDGAEVRSELQDKQIYYDGLSRDGERLVLHFHDGASLSSAQQVLESIHHDMNLKAEGGDLVLSLKPETRTAIQDQAVKQNILALRNRVNELGAKEPIIQQQGADRIIVQLPGVQDTAKAKDIIGRTASLEIHLVDEDHPNPISVTQMPPPGDFLVLDRQGIPVFVRKAVVLSGDVITDAGAGFDSQSNRPTVNISMDAKGARIIRQVSRDNLKKRMAILLLEKSKTEAISVATIQDELGARFQITGLQSSKEANDLALLLRAGALAAPMDFLEERTVGPSLGAENIARGFHSTWIGFAAIAVFMVVYYALFGTISVVALAVNVLLLVGLLSLLQATLTLPGMAAIALTVGMAIDANVLINERIREELRNGNSPGAAIHAGYDRAFGTILDSNVTTGIAGLALFAFGSGPVKGFAVVLVLGILTSMFSSVLVSRALINLIYGRRRKIDHLSIGM
ncbi:MAG: protein translocase subunit SecD [Ferrovum myxofaciens]|uniref:Protein translocase subunit SecD n=2 Tax=root TaxID=1 RepID=A0A149VY56_9PROT|nr:protein translocase subunit SecD [Ferrovum myxofaciens]KXW58149.1 protein translocase subunit SecD [Ferrovum myxofaciens]QKE40878.1 MAG: protein translocase subunit SecD [Ferrovum myxofaciens]